MKSWPVPVYVGTGYFSVYVQSNVELSKLFSSQNEYLLDEPVVYKHIYT